MLFKNLKPGDRFFIPKRESEWSAEHVKVETPLNPHFNAVRLHNGKLVSLDEEDEVELISPERR
ncbi:hypothetical protein A3B18_00210 [Candidatus Giovannonibacteria bacterium RIFCSPLOWO2_01_FULL_46_13]|uniref:Uncharacterized protein n=1 Tax=Candidatus Giovannonibacteria bacterium RIFCSPLOWO2_01_FULL_46_13 TaxID=1798352 RepID=A0A1F5X3E5_9BACT|nr:MAG: hypothetical protein A3B18_00210 [Candidatus Giovannonibacteria bacterium RIFCSPLOWO2_01_FULL_46_13]